MPIPTTSSSRTTGTGDGFSSSDNNGGAVNGHSSGGREYYNLTNNEKYSRGRRLKKDSFDFTSQSEEILDEFGDVVVVRSDCIFGHT